MSKKNFSNSIFLDKLLYVLLIVVFFVTAVTAVTSAKFTSRIDSFVVSNVSNALIDFADGNDGTIVLNDWKPGETKTVNFTVRNFNDKNEVNELSINYLVKIKTSALLPLNFELTKTTKEVVSSVPFTLSKEPETTFSIYSSNEFTLPHSVSQLDSYALKITWPIENNDAESLEAGGEYVKIVVDWHQNV